MEQQTTIKDAINLLSNATGFLKLDRTEHNNILIALQMLQKLDTDYQTALKTIDLLQAKNEKE